MKTKITVLVLLLALLGGAQLVHGSSEALRIATGPLHWTQASACEDPVHGGGFLQYYLTNGCGRQVFLNGNLSTKMVGSTIWAEGRLVDTGACLILYVRSFSLCPAPSLTD